MKKFGNLLFLITLAYAKNLTAPVTPSCSRKVGDLCEGRICLKDDDCFTSLVCSSIYYVCEKPIVLKKIKLKIEKSSGYAAENAVARAIGIRSKVYRTPFETETELRTFITIFYLVAILMVFMFLGLCLWEIFNKKKDNAPVI